MQLLIIQDYLRGGGTEAQSVFVANMLYDHGCAVGCTTFRPGGVQRASLRLPEYAVTVLQPWDTGVNTWSPGLIRHIRAVRPEAVLLMGYAANEKGTRIKRVLPAIRLIASMRTGKMLSTSYRQTLACADHVVVNSQWGLELLIKQGWARAEHIVQINNPLTRDWDSAQANVWRVAQRQRLRIPEDTCVLLNVAGFRPHKGQDELIQLVRAWPTRLPWKLLLVGDGPQLKHCKQLIQRLKLEDRVICTGYLANPGPIMAAADIMLTASRRDAQPNALVEAQAMGLPIVAYDFAGIGECFADGKSGFLVPWGSADLFLQHVELLAANPALRKRHAQFAVSWAQDKFAATQVKEKYLTLVRGYEGN